MSHTPKKRPCEVDHDTNNNQSEKKPRLNGTKEIQTTDFVVANPTAVAHLGSQMRTVLSTANTIASLLGSELEDQNQREYLALMKTSLTQLSQITSDFEYYAKLEHNLVEVNITNFDLHKAVEDVVYGVGLSCDVSCVIGINVPRSVRGDLSRMSKIIRNFLNGLSFSIVSHLGCFDFHILLSVEAGKSSGTNRIINFTISSGTGKEASLLENSNSFEMGLELPIAKRLVRSMGGTLDLESPGDVNASRFKFSVQLEDVTQAKDLMLNNRLNDQNLRDFFSSLDVTIFLIEKNAEIVRFFKSYLSVLGLDCRIMSDCEETRQAIAQFPIEKDFIVFIYLQEALPGPDVDQFNKWLRKSDRWYSPIIMFTPVPDSRSLTKNLIRAGFTDCVAAPLSLETLFNCLSTLCGNPPPMTTPARPSVVTNSLLRSSFDENSCQQTITPNMLIGKILVVDDNLVNQMMLTRILSTLGLRYEVASNGREAVNAYKKDHEAYSVILMDTMMPVCDGFLATHEIREFETQSLPSRHIPIIAVTGMELLDTLNVRDRCLTSGMDDYISKPVTKKTLKDTLFLWISKGNIQKKKIPSLFGISYCHLLSRPKEIKSKRIFTLHDKVLISSLLKTLLERDAPVNEHLLSLIRSENLLSPLLKFKLQPNSPFKANKLVSLLKGHTELTELDVSGCSYLTDAGLFTIVDNFPMLKVLNLSKTRISNHGLYRLQHLKKLETLSICQCPFISKNGVSAITGLNLKTIVFDP